jgi:hypothetical protein
MKLTFRNKYPGVYKIDLSFWRFYFCVLVTVGDNSVVGHNQFRIQTSFEIARKR